MPVMLPSAEQLSLWAAEELWDWRVRALFALVCIVAALAILAIYLVGNRGKSELSGSRARRYLGRIAVTLAVIAVAEISFFKEPVSLLLLLITAAVAGVAGLEFPPAPSADPSALVISSSNAAVLSASVRSCEASENDSEGEEK